MPNNKKAVLFFEKNKMIIEFDGEFNVCAEYRTISNGWCTDSLGMGEENCLSRRIHLGFKKQN